MDVSAILKEIGRSLTSGAAKNIITPEAITKMQREGMQKAAKVVEEAPKKTSFLKRLGTAAGGVLKTVAPIAASFIPGVGPIASKILSTLNDDEWFGEYKSAGATFNEMLAIQSRENDVTAAEPLKDIVGAVAFVKCEVLPSSYWKDQILPTILAYVRDKTENVLNATEAQYWEAFISASSLYAIYYNLLKYKELMRNLPLNIPMLSKLIVVANPLNYSMLCGVIESLRGYLESTIKLPYAWTEYLRWRFGTTFRTSNTGKPGLVMYDIINYWDAPTDVESDLIDLYKGNIVSAGRAVADINLAYKDHQIRYDVEESHYDEKEFCLRSNYWTNFPGPFGTTKFALVYMDSRLDSSAALQAVTISTNGDVASAPIHVTETKFAWYNQETFDIDTMYDTSKDGYVKTVSYAAGWHTGTPVAYQHNYQVHVVPQGVSNFKVLLGSAEVELDGAIGTIDDAALRGLEKLFAAYVADTLEFHNLAMGFKTYTEDSSANNYFFRGKSLAYDTAYVNATQVDAIHRIALRNLVRGTYKCKVPVATRSDIKESVGEMVEVVKDEVAKEI